MLGTQKGDKFEGEKRQKDLRLMLLSGRGESKEAGLGEAWDFS